MRLTFILHSITINKELKGRKIMTVATKPRYGVGETVGIHVDDLNFGLNARYGWGNGNILEAYKAKNEALKQKIEEWGFRKAHAVEAYYDEGKLTVKHGNRRTFAAKWIHDEDPDAVIAWDLPAGEIWVTIVEKPSSVIELLNEQVADNEQLAATKLDTLMVYQARVDELIKSGEVKTANNAVKLIAKQDFKGKAASIVELGKAASIDEAYKHLKKELSAYEANLKKDLRVMTLSPQVLSWLQESYLDACDIKLSFGKINELLNTYGEKADLLLKEALQEVTLEPREEYSQNQYLSSKWLENLAKKLGLDEEEKPVKNPQKPAPVTTSSDDTDEEKEELTLESQVEEQEEVGAEEKSKNAKTGNIQTRAKKARDYYFLQAQKLLDSNVGLMLVDATLKPLEDGLTEFSVIIPTTETAKEFQSFIDNIAAALGNAEAIAKLEAINPKPVAPEPAAEETEPKQQEATTANPLDDVDLGDIEY
jgi:hypothetical protein